ncbi:hypothetical protein E4U19_003611 [Claviceps sp. Clav32 group G5]|nr:hypothetical protein E4U19_003611 [Claviceps sp. Clav32 group G5]KAG6044171.1 hypothetical protein E4U39_003625 [Claviceps sp. Clav50 group G5]
MSQITIAFTLAGQFNPLPCLREGFIAHQIYLVLVWLEDVHLLLILTIETKYRARQPSMAHIILLLNVSIHDNGLSFMQP